MNERRGTVPEPRHFRDVLGQFPTGVAVVTALDPDGAPVGMAVGSFSSVSLDPPLVAFMPARTSSTYPVIADAPHFCVSILGADQEEVCRAMATRGADKFSEIDWFPAPSGAPIIADSLAWIDCTPAWTHEAGDHLIVLGTVDQLAELRPGPPLVFFRGGYGGFATASLMAAPERDIVEPIRLAGRARSLMEDLAKELDLECLAVGAVGEQSVCLAIADSPSADYIPSRVGYRTPFVFPVGSVFVAWDPARTALWLPADAARAAGGEAALRRVRDRRWSVATGDDHYDDLERAVGQLLIQGQDDDGSLGGVMNALRGEQFDPPLEPHTTYDVRMLMAPVFGPHGVELGIAVRGFRNHLDGAEIEAIGARLIAAADEVSRKIGGDATVAALTPSTEH
ncbi:flavin reductase [Nocardioides endophyticus]|uniref:Flavin reductase n=1 Tax=Nocardioides endophyticus TaxID=1353775 RepID=A0ABP8ZCU8_9ACTN